MRKYSAQYFRRAERALLETGNNSVATIQVFQREHSVLAGVDEAVDIIKDWSYGYDRNLKIKALPDGSRIDPWETAMLIEAPLVDIVALESIYLGVLARSTRVATNMRRVVDAAGSKPVLFMGDRFDRWENQESDGEAALLGGASAICTSAMGRRTGEKAQGTMPHALIAAYGGDVVEAAKALRKAFPDEPVSGLVDFNNDCVGDSLRLLAEFRNDLHSVRLDTSGNMMDKSINVHETTRNIPDWDTPAMNRACMGVNPTLVHNVRSALNIEGGNHVKIVVSGGFTPEKIRQFELCNVPVDMYGVGSSIIKNGPDFTADVVLLDGKPMAKKGREFRPNDRLVEV